MTESLTPCGPEPPIPHPGFFYCTVGACALSLSVLQANSPAHDLLLFIISVHDLAWMVSDLVRSVWKGSLKHLLIPPPEPRSNLTGRQLSFAGGISQFLHGSRLNLMMVSEALLKINDIIFGEKKGWFSVFLYLASLLNRLRGLGPRGRPGPVHIAWSGEGASRQRRYFSARGAP